jgi:hypothetical protein
MSYQRRATQSWVKMSRSAGADGGATTRAVPGGHPDIAKEAGNCDRTVCGHNGVHVDGRSRVIHAFLVGFWCVELPDEALRANRLVGWE